VNIALPESDSDDEFCTRHNLDDRQASAHSTYGEDNAHLSEQQEGNVLSCVTTGDGRRLPQAAAEVSEDTREVLFAPEIELTFSEDEPVLELTRYY